ncbi:MAG: uroporphyrinogen-III synthase [Campylobacterales bacterium]|nr:uroporphyrinogen-III synthase [Campylobacterales bacterium]
MTTDLTTLFNDLKLLYYKYDSYQNKFTKDNTCDTNATYGEFIKLTYELSKNEIQFFIDKNADIVITPKDSIIEHAKQIVKDISYHLKNKNKNIYILSDKYVKYAKNIPLINTISLINKIDLLEYDALIFTSKNGVIHINSVTDKWKTIPSYAISTQTAKEIKKLGGSLKFIGKEKHGDQFANELIPLLSQYKKVAYLGAKDIVSDLITILNENKIDCDHIAVYETVCVQYKEKINLPNDSIIIFSSPSTIRCFFKNVNWKESFKAISIGHTTKKYFPNNITPIISDDTTLQSCVQKALSLVDNI